MLRLEVAGETNVGRKRSHNEDYYAILRDHGLYVVADGMGGHASGEVASRMAVEVLHEHFLATRDEVERTWPCKLDRSQGYDESRLVTGIKLANLRIHETARRDAGHRGMGTTFVGVLASGSGVYVAHVGDSRVYRLRGGRLEPLTDDHSLLNDYIKMKKLTPDEIATFPHKNVIVRALGMKETVRVDTRFEALAPGDVYLLCSDGLSGPVTDPAIADILQRNPEPRDAVTRLIERANECGGPDNITAVVLRCVGG